MKITKTAYEAMCLERRRKKANRGCSTCPYCGGRELLPTVKRWAKGVFKPVNMRIDCYTCMNCRTEWESDPYEVN